MKSGETSVAKVLPGVEWVRKPPGDVGFDEDALERLRRWLYSNAGEKPFRVLIVRRGHLVAEWEKDVSAEDKRSLASAAKSVFSSVLGIAVAEGVIPSAGAPVFDYYPEMMDVPEGQGPKPGRHAFPKDRGITFRQLISNTSGYMKPGEEPGKVFHYQTFGMNILTHALGAIYGVYDTQDPGTEPGFGRLIDRYIKEPIGGSWTHRYANFDLGPDARLDVFGNYCQIEINARDMARLGLLWIHWGRWGEKQLIPEEWMREASRVAPMILENCPQETWSYGYAFWTNEHGLLWPDLPREAFAASGAGSQLIWMCPSLDLVVVQGPGCYLKHTDETCTHVLSSAYRAIAQ